MKRSGRWLGLACALAPATVLHAAPPPDPAPVVVATSSAGPASSITSASAVASGGPATPAVPVAIVSGPVPAAPSGPFIPKLTPVVLQIDGALGSRISTTFDHFPIHLYEPIVVDGHVAVAAGASGWGEVVHAKKAGGSGAAGELVLAARVLSVDGRELHLRSMRLGGSGENHNQAAVALAAVAGIAGAVGGFLMKGSEIVIPAGTIANAKLAEDFVLSDTFRDAPLATVAALPIAEPQIQTEGTKQP